MGLDGTEPPIDHDPSNIMASQETVKLTNIVGNLKYDSQEQIKKIEEEDEPVPLIQSGKKL